MLTRSLKISLELANTGKKATLDELWEAYRQAVSDFLDRLLAHETLSEAYLKSYESRLSYRYKQCAKRQAMKLFKTWCRNKKRGNKPTLRHPMMTLDYRFIEVQKGENSFDFWIKITTLEKGQPILIPAKSYSYLNTYLENWELVLGGKLIRQKGRWYLVLAFKKETSAVRDGQAVSVDLGYRKLGVTSEGEVIGAELRSLIEKADSKKPKSNAYYRAKAEIKNYINRELKKLFRRDVGTIVVEDLKRLKDGKRGKWGKDINRKFGFWIYGHALRRIQELAEVAGVQRQRVPPRGTSQTCPLCGHAETLNRQGERFKCRRCGFSHDADYVGALNILSRFSQQPIVADAIKLQLEYFSIK
jgi:IS605 OrfB family transposase